MLLPLLIVATTAAAFVSAAACPSHFQVHPNGNKDYCMTVGDINTAGPATVQKCNGSPGQDWYWDIQGYSDIIHLRNVAPASNQLCLAAEVYRISGAYNGRQLATTGCYNDGAQSFTPITTGTAPIVMIGTVDNRQVCMDLRDGNLDGGAVQIWYCYPGNTNQLWSTSS